MYDSILYGNGLTLSVLSLIKENCKSEFIHYLDFDNFIFEFVHAENHSRIIRDFLKNFTINTETIIAHNEARNKIKNNYKEIASYGFERWVSKYLFDPNSNFKEIKGYIYFLYNYWFHVIDELILKKARPTDIISKIGNSILTKLGKNTKVFTTNFDTIMDSVLNPNHIHGRFQIQLTDYNDIIAFHINDKEYEYKYLYGANGLEKLYRLDTIRKNITAEYDIDFFYNDILDLGSLLIYGLSFGRTEFISDEFLKLYPENKENRLVRTVDGHILLKLSIKYNSKKLKKITIAYYKDSDKMNY